MRHLPLQSALRAGCISIEADVWAWGDEILVSHSRYTVLRGTLQSLYLKPLLKLLDTHNWSSRSRSNPATQEIVGVFPKDPKQTFTLLVDFKSEGDRIWPLLIEQLHPFREKGYLTHFNGSDVIYGPITVVASGDASFHLILENTTYRDVFYDAPLDNLTFPAELVTDGGNQLVDKTYSPYNSYYASTDFHKAIGFLPFDRLSDVQLATLRSQVQAAHALGLKVRYWGTPTGPIGLRNHIRHLFVHEGVDVIETDDLRDVTGLDWTAHRWWKR